LADELADAIIVVDESFMPFVSEQAQYSVLGDRRQNILVIRSLTKFFAIPGLRLGFLYGPGKLVDKLLACKEPWTVNALAAKLGEHLLLDPDYEETVKQLVARERKRLTEALGKLKGLFCYPGAANFLLVRITASEISAPQLSSELLAYRLLIRACRGFEGLDDSFFRVAVRRPSENALLIEALAELMQRLTVSL
jgi:threonine-phosphate decarboxylase